MQSSGFFSIHLSWAGLALLSVGVVLFLAACAVAVLSFTGSDKETRRRRRRRAAVLGVVFALPFICLVLLRLGYRAPGYRHVLNEQKVEADRQWAAAEAEFARAIGNEVKSALIRTAKASRGTGQTANTAAGGEPETELTSDSEASRTADTADSPATGTDSKTPKSEPLPDWASQQSEDAALDASQTTVVVRSGQFTSAGDAEAEALRKAATVAGRRVVLDSVLPVEEWTAPESLVRQHLVRQTHTQTVQRDFGTISAPMHCVYLQLDLSDKALAPLRESWHQFAARQRLWWAGGVFGAAALVLGTFSAALRCTRRRPSTTS